MTYQYPRPALWRMALYYAFLALAWAFGILHKIVRLLANGLHKASNQCAIEAYFITNIPKIYK
jgi:hypothetical protein